MKIGFIGTGQMGRPMAHNLLKAKHSLRLYARHPEKVEDLTPAGGDSGDFLDGLRGGGRGDVITDWAGCSTPLNLCQLHFTPGA